MMKRSTRFILAVSGIFLTVFSENSTCLADEGAKEKSGNSMVWRYEGEKATVFVAGSVHALRESDYPLPLPFETAYKNSVRIVFEVDRDGTKLAREIIRRGTYPDGEALGDKLDEDSKKVLAELIRKLPENNRARVSRSRPWLLAIMIPYWELSGLGVTMGSGVDSHFTDRAQEDRKKIEGLVSIQSHVAALADMPEETQVLMLKKTLGEIENIPDEFELLSKAWRSGDVKTISDVIDRYDDIPGYRDALLTNRNKIWIPKIKGYLEGEEDVMVIVGAAHLAGKDSVIDLLHQEGIEGEQLSVEAAKTPGIEPAGSGG